VIMELGLIQLVILAHYRHSVSGRPGAAAGPDAGQQFTGLRAGPSAGPGPARRTR
jgi:hypothetical protein